MRGFKAQARAAAWWVGSLLALASCGPSAEPVDTTRAAEVIDQCTPPSSTATVWAAPEVLKYGTVLAGSAEHAQHPTFKVFIELLDGSADGIDAGSVTLNGVAALPEPRQLGDENENGIPDLKVEFDRTLFEGNIEGSFEVAGQAASGSFSAASSVRICGVLGVERTEYFIDFTTSNMPDPNLNGLPAQLEVRRVKPIFDDASKDCAPTKALVMFAGRTNEAIPAFDLQHGDYSLMEGLAKRGIDTFAVNLLGYGKSRIVSEQDPMIDPRNASLPDCLTGPPASAPCTPVPGVCDCQGVPAIQLMGLQVSTTFLNPNPLATPQAHVSSTRFQRTTEQVADVERAVEDVRAKTGPETKIVLLGYSAGGGAIGPYLDNPTRQAKIDCAIFLDSIFGAPNTLLAEPATPPSWPLSLLRYDSLGLSPSPNPACPGQVESGFADVVWNALKTRESVASGWGPSAPGNTGGFIRFPIVTRWAWQPEASRRISIPILAMVGLLDNVLPAGVQSTINISRNSPQANPCATNADCASGYICETAFASPVCRLNNRILVQVPCASHQILWEHASDSCKSPHRLVRKRVGDFVLKGL